MTDDITLETDLPSELAEWIWHSIGAHVQAAHRVLSGGSRTTWLVDTDGTEPTKEIVLRVENGRGAFANTQLTFEREAVVYRALRNTSVPVPGLIALADDGRKILLSRAHGRADLRRESLDVRRAALCRYVEVLTRLHDVDFAALDLHGYEAPLDNRAHARNEVRFWERIARVHGELDPELDYAFAWLYANAPAEISGTALLHGDAGPGNFVYGNDEVTALIDWEFAHIGDPADDLAWLEFRMAREGESPDLAREMIEQYVETSGRRIDPGALHYYGCLVRVRCAVTAALSIAFGGPLGRGAYRQAHRRLLRDVLLQIVGITGFSVENPELPRLSAVSSSDCFDDALESVARLVSSTRGPSKLHALWLQATVRFLCNTHHFGREIELANDLEAANVVATTEAATQRTSFAALAAAGGAASDPTILSVLTRRAVRNDWLWTGNESILARQHDSKK